MEFIRFGSKSVKKANIEAVSTYMDQVTIHTVHNSYTVYYNSRETAKDAYDKIMLELEKDKNAEG